MGRKSRIRQQRRAADREGAVQLPGKQKPDFKQDILMATMAVKALHSTEPGVVWKIPVGGGLASVEFKSIVDMAQEGYEGIHDLVSDVDFGTHRILAWQNESNPGEMEFISVSLERLADLAGFGRSS